MNNERMAKVVAFAIESHGLSWDEMESRPDFSKSEKINGQTIRYCVIAILLRLGDLLDLDSDRTSDLCLKYCASWYVSQDAVNHNLRHKYIDHFDYDEKKIEVWVTCPNRIQYDIWFSWLQYIRVEIERANTYVFHDSLSVFRLPVPDLQCTPSKEAKFELWKLRFELDETGTFWDVIIVSIYTGQYDYARELVQNSIDACLRKIYEGTENSVPASSPRTWTAPNYTPVILVAVSQREKSLTVMDNGIGMDRYILENFLFKVSGSGMKRNISHRQFAFPSIAMFGVGFISILTRADKVKLLTRYMSSKEEGFTIYLDANLRDAIVEKAISLPIGTRVNIKAKDSAYVKGVAAYLTNILKYPAVEIIIIDEDLLNDIENLIRTYDLLILDDQFESIDGILKEQGNKTTLEISQKLKAFNSIWTAVIGKRAWDIRDADPRSLSKLRKISERSLISVIPAIEPENLPIDGVRYFTISDDAALKEGCRFERGRGVRPASAYLLVVPVQFSDLNIGIEWRSLHSFLITKNEVVKSISFVKSKRFADNPVIVPTRDIYDEEDDIMGKLVYRRNRASLKEEFYEDYVTEIMESEDNPFDLLELMKHRRNDQSFADEDVGNFYGSSLYVHRDNIQRHLDVDFDEQFESNFSGNESIFDSYGGRLSPEEQKILEQQQSAMDKNWEQAKVLERAMDAEILKNQEYFDIVQWYRKTTQHVYQDGFLLPIRLCDLAPIGATAGVANLFADARLSYNVSRNALDESVDKRKVWSENAGKRILTEIQRRVENALEEFEVEYSWEESLRKMGVNVCLVAPE